MSFKAGYRNLWIWEVFYHANFSNLTSIFASVIVFPLKHIIRVSIAFWHQKWQNYCDKSLFPFWMARGTRQLSDGSLFVQSSHWIFLTERLDWQKMIFIIIFYCTINRKRSDMHILPEIASISNRRPLKVNSTTFLFRKRKQLAVYLLLPNLAIWRHFVWLLSGSKLVSMRAPR